MTPLTVDQNRFFSVGGLADLEFSTEMRVYLPPFGFVVFFDASNVSGWNPALTANGQPNPPPRNIQTGMTIDPAQAQLPAPQQGQFGFDAHPSAGIGLRYISPIGVLRLDVGLRLDEIGCIGNVNQSTYAGQVAAANSTANLTATPMTVPYYYAVSRPVCSFFGIDGLPLAWQFSIGEAY